MSIFTVRANVSDDLYGHVLSSAYQNFVRVYNPDYALFKEADIWEKILREPVFRMGIEQRTTAIAGPEWYVEPGDDSEPAKKWALVMEKLIQNIRNFRASRKELAQAVFRAQSFQKIHGVWRFTVIADFSPMEWWVPTYLQDADRKRFSFRNIIERGEDGRNRIKKIRLMKEVISNQWVDWKDSDRYIKVTFDDSEDRLGYGRGLIEAAYFYWFAKGVILRNILQGVERWSQGLLVAKVDGSKAASEDRDNDTLQTEMQDAIKKGRTHNSIVIDKDDDIQVHEPAGTAWRQGMDALRYLDDQVTRLFSGSLRPTGGGSGSSGARAQAEVESDESESLVQFDREVLDERIDSHLLGYVLRTNWSNFVKAGIAGAPKGKFRTRQRKRENPVDNAQILSTMLQVRGMKFDADDVYQALGRKRPKEGDDVIEGSGPAQQTLPGPFNTNTMGFSDAPTYMLGCRGCGIGVSAIMNFCPSCGVSVKQDAGK